MLPETTTKLETKSITLNIFKYAIPTVLSMWIFTFYTMIDGIFISRFVGEKAFAGVSLTLPLINFIFSLSIMIGVGSSTLIAIKFGEKKYNEGNQIFTLAFFFNLFLGLIISFLIYFNINYGIKFLGVKEDVYLYMKEYLSTIILFSVFYMSGYACEIYIKVDRNPIFPAICVLIGGMINLSLDYVFVVVCTFGVKGAAVATGISQVCCSSLLVGYILIKAKTIKFIKIKLEKVRTIFLILKTGFSEFLTEITTGLVLLIFNTVILKKIGTYGVSSFGMISYITSFVVMTMIGFSQGVQPLISYNLGNKNFKNMKSLFKISLISLSCLGIIFYFLINIFSKDFVEIFFQEKFNILYTKKNLEVYSLAYLVLGINIFISAYLTAVKKVFYSSLITIVRGILLNSIFILVLYYFWGEKGIWLTAFFSEVISIFFSVFLFLRWKKYYFE